MKNIGLLVLGMFLCISITAQNQLDSSLYLAEDYLLKNKKDSTLYIISKIENSESKYIKRLKKIASKEKIDNLEFNNFLVQFQSRRRQVSYQLISDFIDREVEVNNFKSNDIDLDYVKIRWSQISELRNLNQLDVASEKNKQLIEYIDQFDPSKRDVKRARILADNHQIVLYQIQKEVEKGLNLTRGNEKLAREIKDTNLIVLSIFQRCDFLILQGNLDEFIKISEQSLQLDELQKVKSSTYQSTISHLIDAYIYKGGNDSRIKELLKKLETDDFYKAEVISYYGKYLRFANPEETDIQFVLDYFNAETVVEAAENALKQADNIEDKNAYYHVLKEFAGALINYNYPKAGENFYQNAIAVTQQLYSQNLAKSLAAAETDIVKREKNLEVKIEKEKSTLYLIIGGLAFLFLLLALFAIVKKQRQSRVLAEKNEQIETALHEKQLLLKEVHHRVKNNFEIISSLLELQSIGIEDHKAKELAAEGQNRVKSMALIHQRLYQNDDLLIYFDEYIDKLVNEIAAMYGGKNKTDISINVEKIAFDIDTAIPLGLIVNELVTNSFKYAQSNENTQLNIGVKKVEDNQFCLEVRDNGEGLPSNFNINKAKSLGLRLIRNLSRQLQGRVDYFNDNGAVFKVYFKNTAARQLVD